MRQTRSLAFTIAFLVHAVPGHAQSQPLLECELAPLLCPQVVERYLDGPAAIERDTASALGILAARLARFQVGGAERRAVSEALDLIAESMVSYDDDLAEHIQTVADRRFGSEGPDDVPAPRPPQPPIFASPS